jgi:glutathione reductase (NADPH)
MTIASHFAADFRDSAAFGWVMLPARHDWHTLIRHKNEEIARLNAVYRELLSSAGCSLFDDRATFVDAHTLEQVRGYAVAKIKEAIAAVTGG